MSASERHQQGAPKNLPTRPQPAQGPPKEALLCRDLTAGVPWWVMNKMNVFSPNEVEATKFSPGRHQAAPMGRVVAPARDELLLFHYHHVDFKRVQRRHAHYYARQRKTDLAMGWGGHYATSAEELLNVCNRLVAMAVDVVALGSSAWQMHSGPRWWDHYPRATTSNDEDIGRDAPVGQSSARRTRV